MTIVQSGDEARCTSRICVILCLIMLLWRVVWDFLTFQTIASCDPLQG